MKRKKIYIGVEPALFDRFSELYLNAETISFLGGTLPVEIGASTPRPSFQTREQIEYLKNIGISERDLRPEQYRMYISSDITEVTEQPGGVDLPASVLDSQESFKEDVLSRIKKEAGSPEDN